MCFSPASRIEPSPRGRSSSAPGRRRRPGPPRSCSWSGSERLVGLVAVVGDADADADRLLRPLVQPLAAALDGCEELVEVDLERREDAVGPVLHLEASLAGLAPRLVDDLLRLA